MGIYEPSGYLPPVWLPNGHLQTIYPSIFRKVVGINYHRERVETPDGDFLLLDWSPANSSARSRTLIILSHGFEGDSHRPYITGMVKVMNGQGHDCLAWNYRSCGGELNNTPLFYHSGATDDLDLVIRCALEKGYEKVGLIGFSLGGNLTMKYLGEERDRPRQLEKALCFSVPFDLEACSRHLDSLGNRVYQYRFLKTLREKIKRKAQGYPANIDVRLLAKVVSVYSFDDVFTGPLHGYKNAHDYYSRCSSRNFLNGIQIPARVIHALNDPMIPPTSLPLKDFAALRSVDLWITPKGGHCGYPFSTPAGMSFWGEEQAALYFAPSPGL